MYYQVYLMAGCPVQSACFTKIYSNNWVIDYIPEHTGRIDYKEGNKARIYFGHLHITTYMRVNKKEKETKSYTVQSMYGEHKYVYS